MSTTISSTPVADAERITSIDVLRGFALLGILVMNIQSFSMISAAYMNPTAYGDLTGANWWVWAVSHVLTDQKMYGLFSMLFGAGIVLMASRAEARGERSARLHYRRMGWLLLFGLLHGHLLWYGDILYSYAMCGMLVFLFRRAQPKTLFILAAVFYGIGSALYLVSGWSMQFWPPEAITGFLDQGWRPPPAAVEEELAIYRGGWLTQMPHRATLSLFLQTLVFFMSVAWKTTGNMLLGMALFKTGVLTGERSTPFYQRLMAIGFVVGVPLAMLGIARNYAAGWDGRYSFFQGSQYNYWAAIIIDMGWIGLVILAMRSGALAGLVQRLDAVGRMAFTNYIMQTLIATTLFYGHGFGLYGSVSRVGQIGIVLAVWALQLIVSPIWLSRFQYGPLEWGWRSLTYGRRMPMRRAGLEESGMLAS